MAKKKSSISKEPALTKTDLVNYIGPIFEELKTTLATNAKVDSVRSELIDRINWQGTLMEQMNRKIDVALEFSQMTQSHHMTLNEHTSRLENLERDVRVLKIPR